MVKVQKEKISKSSKGDKKSKAQGTIRLSKELKPKKPSKSKQMKDESKKQKTTPIKKQDRSQKSSKKSTPSYPKDKLKWDQEEFKEQPFQGLGLIQQKKMKPPKSDQMKLTKDMRCYLNDLISYLEQETGIDIQNTDYNDQDQSQIRNNELFPFLKEHGEVDEKNNQIMLSKDGALTFLGILKKIIPATAPVASTFPHNDFNKWFQYKSSSSHSQYDDQKKVILIRKQDMNLHKYDTRNKNLIKMIDQSGDYIDDVDMEMIKKKQKLDLMHYKQPTPKWMNFAWDAFRIVDNHSKSMIFQMPDDPKNEEYNDYIKCVEKPLSLESIRNKLNMRFYSNFDEYIDDMNTLFNNFVKFRGEEHKMYKYCEAVQKRFEKFIEKAKQKSNIE